MAENPSQYAKLANEGILLGYPVKIAGQHARPDNGIKYHSTIKYFDPSKDHPHSIHNLAQHLPLNPPDAKNTQIKFDKFKDRLGNDVHVVTLHGNSADKLKEHNGKFAGMGFPSQFEWTPHVSVDKNTWDKLQSSGAKTAHEAGIEFGPAELKRGPKTLKTYHHEPDSAEPKVPDESDFTAKMKAPVTKSEKLKPLMKPYVSEAQRRWAHTASGKEALGGEAGVHEWDEATKGKKLPEKVAKSDKKVCMTKPAFIAEHKELVGILKHPSKKGINREIKDQSKELKEEMAKNKLEKGALKNAIAGGAALLASHGAHASGADLHSLIGGIGKIPGVKVSSQFNPYVKNGKHGEGQYKVHVGKYSINGKYHSNGSSSNHETSLDGPQNGGPHDPDYNKAKFLKDKLSSTGTEVLERSELQKGALKNAGIALGMAGALAGSSHQANPSISDNSPAEKHAQSYDHSKMLRAIAQVESNGGVNTNHKPAANGEIAFGKYGLMPGTITDTIKAHKDLNTKYGKAMALKGDNLHRYMQDNKGLEDQIADRHLAHMEHVLGNNPEHLGFAWYNGTQGALNALKNKQDISNHFHVKKIRDAYGKEK